MWNLYNAAGIVGATFIDAGNDEIDIEEIQATLTTSDEGGDSFDCAELAMANDVLALLAIIPGLQFLAAPLAISGAALSSNLRGH